MLQNSKFKIQNSKFIPLFTFYFLLFTFLVFDLFSFGFNYHPAVPTKDWIGTPPPTAEYLQKREGEFRIVDAGSDPLWNQIFWHHGWTGQLDQYKNLRNSLFTNSGVYYGIKSAGVYSGVQLQRIKNLFEVLKKELAVAPGGALVLTEKGAEFLSLLNVKFFVSPVNLASDNFALSFHAESPPPAHEFAVFENLNFLPRARFVEAEVPADAKITKTYFSNQKIEIFYDAPKETRLLLADTYYPGWKAFVDGKEIEVFPADLNGKFVLAPKGTHKVEFVYSPRSFLAGKLISIASLFVWCGMLLGIKLKTQKSKVKTAA